MQQKLSLKLLPSEASDDATIKKYISSASGKKVLSVTGYHLLKRSMDARGKQVFINLQLNAFIDEPFIDRKVQLFTFPDVSHAEKKVVIIGAGPAGLFAALKLIQSGIQPTILERGKDVKARRRDLALLNKEGTINPESNYCFGEGGAGTYSDGKLYTRSKKRGDVDRILQLFVHFGAPFNILYDSHPHIGTNKLPQIITSMRRTIVECGGSILFEKKVSEFVLNNNLLSNVITADGDHISADAFILATGHSARDIFMLLHKKNILVEAKPFALGVRVEHPQSLIDHIQYSSDNNIRDNKRFERPDDLPPASYSLVEQVDNRGVFSFCMCPGGIIAPASTCNGELVVNGWSPSRRNNPFANSGLVVQVEARDARQSTRHLNRDANPFLFMNFQRMVEEQAYNAGGGNFVAPAQRMQDFVNKKVSSSLPSNSYIPGLNSADLQHVLPGFIYNSLARAFVAFGKKMKGYYTNDAVVVATESRTSSPVRIPREDEGLNHPQVKNLYPCGEGAGYAGGIVSAAMDGEKVAEKIYEKYLLLS